MKYFIDFLYIRKENTVCSSISDIAFAKIVRYNVNFPFVFLYTVRSHFQIKCVTWIAQWELKTDDGKIHTNDTFFLDEMSTFCFCSSKNV